MKTLVLYVRKYLSSDICPTYDHLLLSKTPSEKFFKGNSRIYWCFIIEHFKTLITNSCSYFLTSELLFVSRDLHTIIKRISSFARHLKIFPNQTYFPASFVRHFHRSKIILAPNLDSCFGRHCLEL